MRILLFVVFCGSCAQAMDQKPRLSKIAETSNSVLNFFKSIPDTVKEVMPGVFQDSSGSEKEEYSGSESSPKVQTLSKIPYRTLHESPPKCCLDEAVYLGDYVPEMPTIFQIQNKAKVGVLLVAVLTAPYRPKKYFLQPNDCFMSMSPDVGTTYFEQVFVQQSQHNRHIAAYKFESALCVRLFITEDPLIKGQLCIRKKLY